MKKRILMVGAGSCQKNAILRMKSMGYEVVAADFNETTEAKEMADYQARADAFSPEDILKCAQEYGVDGVMTAGTDQPVLAVTKTANHLGLSAFLRNETALLVTNKKYMKEKFQEKGIPTVRFRVIGKNFPDAQLSGMQPPFVLKPLDSQGQRGIFLVHTVEEVRKMLESVLKYSRSEEILVEEFYANEEITVSGWVDRGTVFILTITDRVTFSPQEHLGVCTSHENPSKYLGEHGNSLKALTRKICTDFHIEEGPVYFQFLHGNEGIKVNEIACRLGGAYEDLTIPYATGADVLRMNIEGCLDPNYYKGELKAAPEAEDSRPYSTRLFFCKEGRVADLTPLEEIRNLPFVLDAGYNVHVGEELPAIENASQRAGFVIVKGETRLEVEENLQQLRRIMSVRDEEGNNLIRTL
ncbi:ATP-grasp domain-containing protein [Proteiniclasticum sp. BAD-10]|uniref:ATP-grasp domain-containing protein n=1 Tax=Proteiniclasticum sediminis TaxID=2804028 RepID=A0A941CTS4_9CLOT|nr:ATP-grasp domain-containing protein [Proteiniclasticum sediminis]MBR0577266.1 ATP-grasp domain-containing protein [Proteiniclasticum sediminis]